MDVFSASLNTQHHQTGVTTRRRRIDAQRALSDQAPQGDDTLFRRLYRAYQRPFTGRQQRFELAIEYRFDHGDLEIMFSGLNIADDLDAVFQGWRQIGRNQAGRLCQHQRLVTGRQNSCQLVHQHARIDGGAQNRAARSKTQGIALARRTRQDDAAVQQGGTRIFLRQMHDLVLAVLLGPYRQGIEGRASLALVLRARRCISLQAFQVQGTTGFRAGARFAFATKRLHADYGTHDVAVHIDIAHVSAAGNEVDGFIDARMDAQGQAITAVIDRLHQLWQVRALVADHVQHGAKDFLRQLRQRFDFQHGRRHKGTGDWWQIERIMIEGHGFHLVDVRQQIALRFSIDDGTDIGRQTVRIANTQFLHRTFQHLDSLVGDVFLQEQDAQGRAALAGAVKSRRHHVLHHLFRQGGRIDDQGVLATGFSDQGNIDRLGYGARRQGAVDQLRDFRRASENHAFHAR